MLYWLIPTHHNSTLSKLHHANYRLHAVQFCMFQLASCTIPYSYAGLFKCTQRLFLLIPSESSLSKHPYIIYLSDLTNTTSLLSAYATKKQHLITQPCTLATCFLTTLILWDTCRLRFLNTSENITNIHGGINTLLSTYVPVCLETNTSPPTAYDTCLLSHYVTPPIPLLRMSSDTTSSIPLLRMSFLTLLHLCLSLTSTAASNGSTRVASAS